MRISATILKLFILIFLVSCADKKVFYPKTSDAIDVQTINKKISLRGIVNPSVSIESKYIINGKKINLSFFEKSYGIENILFSNQKYFLIATDNAILIADKNTNKTKSIKLKTLPILGYIDNEIICILSIDNEIFIYDINNYELLFSKKQKDISSISKKIAMIKRMNDKLIIPLLNGKLVFFDISKNKIENEYHIDTNENFSNFNNLYVDNNFIFASTKNKLFSLYNNNTYVNDEVNAKTSIYYNSKIYVFDIDGHLYILDKSLRIKEKIYFKNASSSHIDFYKDNLYFIESQGYIVFLNANLSIKKVFFNKNLKEKNIINRDNKIFFKNSIIDLSKLSI